VIRRLLRHLRAFRDEIVVQAQIELLNMRFIDASAGVSSKA